MGRSVRGEGEDDDDDDDDEEEEEEEVEEEPPPEERPMSADESPTQAVARRLPSIRARTEQLVPPWRHCQGWLLWRRFRR